MAGTENQFRKDVDLLRGLAILLVLLYHMDIPFVKSGFVGVDIFFVLSGYLIAYIYHQNPVAKDFYERRFRRILPAMLVVMLGFLWVSPFLFLPFEVEKITDSIWGSLLFIPNIIFWRDNDYFANLDFSPLLHYWSLGVELQFYLIFPILFALFRKSMLWFWGVLIFSLVLCVGVTTVSSKTAFFLLPTRLWEFLLGGFAFSFAQSNLLSNLRLKINTDYVCLFFLALLIVFSCIAIPQSSFPGFYALVPALLSSLIILLGVSNNAILDNSIVVAIRWLAKISFSVYLIHFPVILIFKYGPFSEFKTLTWMDQIGVIAVTLFLATLSFKFIETPFRSKRTVSLPRLIASLGVIYLLVAITLVVFNYQNYFVNHLETKERKIVVAMMDRGGWRCSKLQKFKEYKEDSCYLYKTSDAKKIVYLVGDSHIDVIKEVFVDLAKESNASIRLNKVRCLLGTYQCASSSIISDIEKFSITDVVLHGYEYKLFDYADLTKLIDYSRDHNIRLHFIGPIPTYSASVPASLHKEYLGLNSGFNRQSLGEFESSIPREYLGFIEKNRQYSNVHFYFPEKILCPSECLLGDEGAVFYFDSNHLNLTGAKQLTPLIKEILTSK